MVLEHVELAIVSFLHIPPSEFPPYCSVGVGGQRPQSKDLGGCLEASIMPVEAALLHKLQDLPTP